VLLSSLAPVDKPSQLPANEVPDTVTLGTDTVTLSTPGCGKGRPDTVTLSTDTGQTTVTLSTVSKYI
jgi:hypothetical protein